jgi:hypothetical protein
LKLRKDTSYGEDVREDGTDADAFAAGGVSGVDYLAFPQVKGNVAFIVKGVAFFNVIPAYFVHRKAALEAGVAVNVETVEHIGHGDKAGTINAQMGFAPPAVLNAEVGPGGADKVLPELFFACGRGRK